MTDASEADGQAAVPAPRPSGGPRDTSATTAPGAAAADTGPAPPAGTRPDATSADTGPAPSAGTRPDATTAGTGPAAGSRLDGGAAEWGVADTRRAEVYVRLLAESE